MEIRGKDYKITLPISRRTLLIGGGAAAGLVVAWGLWPREYRPNLRAAPGEILFNAFLKIGIDGRVIVAVPQAEIGQGVYTSLPQILADELGADWRTVAVEAAPISPIYANQLIAGESVQGGFFEGARKWTAREYATRNALMMTGGSTSIRAFEPRMREAGAAARALLMQAAADRWDADWESLDTAQGHVFDGTNKLSFAELAAEASEYDVPDALPIRGGIDNRLTGQPLPRIDLPAKVDGSAQFAGDIRLPDMLYASVRHGPRGDSRLLRIDRAAADAVPGVVAVFQNPGWVGAAATNWWAANQAVQRMKPVFEIKGPLAGSAAIDAALIAAMESGSPSRIFSRGDADDALEAQDVASADYMAGLAPNAAIETLTATARFTGDRLEIWAPTQAPGLARAAAARAVELSEPQVALYPALIGGGYGRKLENTAIEQAAIMAKKLDRPVQLVWSRSEELAQDTFRPPVRAALSAKLARNGTILGWRSRIAAPSTMAEVTERIRSGETGGAGTKDAAAVAGAIPPYAIPSVAIDHLPVDIGIATGVWRSAAHSYTAFFTESFMDELARKSGIEPLSFRMQVLGQNPRLAKVLTMAASMGGWDGGAPGSAMGIAAHSAFGSHIAILAEVEVGEDQKIRVVRAMAAVDCGRVINPQIVRQLVEGGILYGIAGATGNPIAIENGFPDSRTIGSLGLPRLPDSPEIQIEIMENDEDSGGVTEIGVPAIAPAIANALFALTGQRLRALPLALGAGK